MIQKHLRRTSLIKKMSLLHNILEIWPGRSGILNSNIKRSRPKTTIKCNTGGNKDYPIWPNKGTWNTGTFVISIAKPALCIGKNLQDCNIIHQKSPSQSPQQIRIIPCILHRPTTSSNFHFCNNNIWQRASIKITKENCPSTDPKIGI